MPAFLVPADSPSEELFTLGNIAAELELEPRRANLLDNADGQDDLAPDAPNGAAALKGCAHISYVVKRVRGLSAGPKKVAGKSGVRLTSAVHGMSYSILF